MPPARAAYRMTGTFSSRTCYSCNTDVERTPRQDVSFGFTSGVYKYSFRSCVKVEVAVLGCLS